MDELDTLSKEHLKAIGSLTVDFVVLERMLMTCIIHLLSSDPQYSKRVLATDNFSALLAKFKKLLIYRLQEKGLYDESIKKEYKSLYDDLDKINSERNTLIHSMWSVDKEGKAFRHKYLKQIDKNLKIDNREPIDVKSLNDLSYKLNIITSKLWGFRKKFIKSLSLDVKTKIIY